jgi:hypothetical protein
MSTNRYQRIGNDESGLENAMEMSSLSEPSAPPVEQTNPLVPRESGESFAVKVLLKEKTFELTGLTNDMQIGAFKSAIQGVTSVQPAHQRLIFAGKQLKPDTKTLGEFKIVAGSSIHLFPLPVATPPIPVANAVETGGATYNPITAQGVSAAATAAAEDGHRPIHFDPYINQTSREVKLWCLILMFLSAMTLFNNLSFVTSTGMLRFYFSLKCRCSVLISGLCALFIGRLGSGVLDSIVTVLDTVRASFFRVVLHPKF